MDNLEIYNKVRSVPENAKKPIEAGRQKGKTDINPMWRIKKLTEQFGPCGVGWKTEIKRVWLERGANEEVAAFVEIALYVKIDGVDGEWGDAIPGLGGSMFIAKEKSGMFTDDDAYKKAYTDAISVACKALGIAADVYYEKDSTKYDKREQQPDMPQSTQKPIRQAYNNNAPAPQPKPQPNKGTVTEKSARTLQLEHIMAGTHYTLDQANTVANKVFGAPNYDALTQQQFNELYDRLDTVIKKEYGNG